MLVAWDSPKDLDVLVEAGDGHLEVDVLNGLCSHSRSGAANLLIGPHLRSWFVVRLEGIGIPAMVIRSALVTGSYTTDEIPTNRDKIVMFSWTCESVITTPHRAFRGTTVPARKWHNRVVA
jgi:hypothetical protein